MKKFGVALIILAIIIIAARLAIMDYSNLSWSRNSGSYLGIIAMLFIIGAGVRSFSYAKKQPKE